MTIQTTRRQALAFGVGGIAGVGGAAPTQSMEDLPLRSVRDQGAKGDGVADDTVAFQAAYDAVAEAGGGTLFIPAGVYRVSLRLTHRNVHVTGEGAAAAVLVATGPEASVLTLAFREGSWDSVSLRDFSLRGAADSRSGIGLRFGEGAYQKDDEYTGRVFLDRVTFDNFEACILRPHGSIGLWLDGCRFGEAEFHFLCRSNDGVTGDPMHAGCLTVRRTRLDRFRKASLYVSSRVDGGQIVFEDCLFEAGTGFVVYLDQFNASGPTPGISFRNCWNEATANGETIQIMDTRHNRARFLFARQVSCPIRFEETPIGDVELIESQVETRSCNLSNLNVAVMDAGSTLRHHDARAFTGTPPGSVLSLAAPSATAGLRTAWFETEVWDEVAERQSAVRLDVPRGRLIVPTGGSPDLQTDWNGDVLFAEGAEIAGPAWIVSLYRYRLRDGSPVFVRLAGTAGLTGEGRLHARDWKTLINISRHVSATTERVTFYHRGTRAGRVECGGGRILVFQTLQTAMDMVDQFMRKPAGIA